MVPFYSLYCILLHTLLSSPLWNEYYHHNYPIPLPIFTTYLTISRLMPLAHVLSDFDTFLIHLPSYVLNYALWPLYACHLFLMWTIALKEVRITLKCKEVGVRWCVLWRLSLTIILNPSTYGINRMWSILHRLTRLHILPKLPVLPIYSKYPILCYYHRKHPR